MAFAMMGKIPVHTTWAGSVLGGLTQAASNAIEGATELIRGGYDSQCGDSPKVFVKTKPSGTLHVYRDRMRQSMRTHMMSIENPQAVRDHNAQIEKFLGKK